MSAAGCQTGTPVLCHAHNGTPERGEWGCTRLSEPVQLKCPPHRLPPPPVTYGVCGGRPSTRWYMRGPNGRSFGDSPLNDVLCITGRSTSKSAGKAVHASTSGSQTKSCDEALHAATPGSTGRLRSSCAIGYYYLQPRQWTGVYASSLHSNLLQC